MGCCFIVDYIQHDDQKDYKPPQYRRYPMPRAPEAEQVVRRLETDNVPRNRRINKRIEHVCVNVDSFPTRLQNSTIIDFS